MQENSNVAKNISNESVEDASSSDRKVLLHVFLIGIQLKGHFFHETILVL